MRKIRQYYGNTLQELPEYNTTIYKHEKYRYSVLSLPPITAEIMRKEFTIDSSQSGSKIWYIIEKSVDLFDSNSYSLELRSHILIRIIQISQGEYLNECLIKEYSVIHYGNLFSTRSQMMESAAEERINFYTINKP